MHFFFHSVFIVDAVYYTAKNIIENLKVICPNCHRAERHDFWSRFLLSIRLFFFPLFLYIHLSFYISIYLFINPSIFLSIHQSFYLSINLFIYPSIFLSYHLSIYQSIFNSSIYLFNYPSISFIYLLCFQTQFLYSIKSMLISRPKKILIMYLYIVHTYFTYSDAFSI